MFILEVRPPAAIVKETMMRIRRTDHDPKTDRLAYCDVCGYDIVRRTRDHLLLMRGPA